MKQIFIAVSFLFYSTCVNAQSEGTNSEKYSLAKKHFESKYEKQEFAKYLKSQIKSYKNKIILDVVKSFEFSEDLNDKSKLILENGLLDPMRINGTYIIKISDINELSLLNPDYKTKRFSFRVYRREQFVKNENAVQTALNSRVNPDEYYFELQNENANENTNFKDFVEGAKLTYLGYGGIII